MPTRWRSLQGLFLRPVPEARTGSTGTRRHFEALDGLRGLAVLLVMESHLGNAHFHLVPGLDLSGTGKYGVYLFFVLSAFLLTHPLVAGGRERLTHRGQWLRYALRRVLRIVPLYYVVLVTHHLATRSGATRVFDPMDTASLGRHLLLQEGMGLYWTVPVEFAYYLLLPFVAVVFVVALAGRVVPVTLASAAAIALALWLWPPATSRINTLHLGIYLPIFLCGSLAACLFARMEEAAVERAAAARRVLAASTPAALLAVACLVPASWTALTGAPTRPAAFHREFLLFGVLWSVVVTGVASGAGPLARFFAWKPLRFVGAVSFSIYLWHLPIVKGLVLGTSLPPTLLAWVASAAAIGAAAVSFLAIERPFARSEWIASRLRTLAEGGTR